MQTQCSQFKDQFRFLKGKQVRSMKEVKAQEYYNHVRVPHAQVRRMSAGRCYDEFVTLCGKELGSKHQVMTARGKVVSETYYINNEKAPS